MGIWRQRTHLEAGLLLISFVTIPFLFLMIITYVYFGLHKSHNPSNYLNCTRLCHYLDQFGRSLYYSLDIKNVDDLPGSEGNINAIYNMAAIVRACKKNTEYKLTYLCSAAVVSPRCLLISTYCLNHDTNDVYARIGSEYWSKGGCLYQLDNVNVNKSRNYALVNLKVKIPDNVTVARVDDVNDTSTFNAVGWNKFDVNGTTILIDLTRVACYKEKWEGYFCGDYIQNMNECLDCEFLPFMNKNLIGLPAIDNIILYQENKFEYKFHRINKTDIQAEINKNRTGEDIKPSTAHVETTTATQNETKST